MIDMTKIEDKKSNVEICKDFCGSCPSYPESDEWLFCARGKSEKEIDRKSCLCPSCQVYMKYQLSGQYFCDKGKAE